MIKGIDISSNNGSIDFVKVKNAGYDFAIIRADYSASDNKPEDKFHEYMQGALAAGMKVGAYWACYGLTVENAREEARQILKWVESYELEYPIAFDLEGFSINYMKKMGVEPTTKLISDMAMAFLDTVSEAGYFAINYANKDFLENKFDNRLDGINDKYGVWYARWFDNDMDPFDYALDKDCLIHQYGSKGTIPGISTMTDMNIDLVNLPKLIREMRLNHLEPTSNEDEYEFKLIHTVETDKPHRITFRDFHVGHEIYLKEKTNG